MIYIVRGKQIPEYASHQQNVNLYILPVKYKLSHCFFRNKKLIFNKANVDYTSPALCTPVTLFPPTGDAAYRQHAREDRATDIGNTHKKLVKIARVIPEIFSQTDRHTDRLRAT